MDPSSPAEQAVMLDFFAANAEKMVGAKLSVKDGMVVNPASGSRYAVVTHTGQAMVGVDAGMVTAPRTAEWIVMLDESGECDLISTAAITAAIAAGEPYRMVIRPAGNRVDIDLRWARKSIAKKSGKISGYTAYRARKLATSEDFCHLHVHSMYCIAGDTVVYNCVRHHNKGEFYRGDYTRPASCKTIAHLYKSWVKMGGRSRYKVKVFDGEKFVPSGIKAIVYSGKKKVYKITTESGKFVVATGLHRFLTGTGWFRLEQISVGDTLACNGVPLYQDRDWLYQKYHVEGVKQAELATICGVDRQTVSTWIGKLGLAKTKSEWMQGHRVDPQTTEKIVAKRISHRDTLPPPATRSGAYYRAHLHKADKSDVSGLSHDLEIHHKDADPFNNDPSNLTTLTRKEHRRLHWSVPTTARYEQVVSIEDAGEVDTYDLEVDHPSHNFVANGIVTHNSFLDGVSTPEGIVQRAVENGQPGIALTDHGIGFGLAKFYQAARKAKIKPVMGIEFYVVDDIAAGYKDGGGSPRRWEYHLTVLASNQQGWENLCELATLGHMPDNRYYVPRIDLASLFKYQEGLIVLSGCFKGMVAWHLQDHPAPAIPVEATIGPHGPVYSYNPDRSAAVMTQFKQVFGDRYYAEVMNIDYDVYNAAVPKIMDLADRIGVPLVVTRDCHYELQEDAALQMVLGRISSKGNVGDAEAFASKGVYYICQKSETAGGLFTDEMLTRTCEVMERCNVHIPLPGDDDFKFMFPKYECEKDPDWDNYLLATQGAKA